MKHIFSILFLLAFAGIASAQTPPDYFAFILSEKATTPASLGAKLPTQVHIYGRPVAAETKLQIVALTSAGSETYWVDQQPSTGDEWGQVAVLSFLRGTAITSVTVRKLNPSEPITVPLEGQPVERAPTP